MILNNASHCLSSEKQNGLLEDGSGRRGSARSASTEHLENLTVGFMNYSLLAEMKFEPSTK